MNTTAATAATSRSKKLEQEGVFKELPYSI